MQAWPPAGAVFLWFICHRSHSKSSQLGEVTVGAFLGILRVMTASKDSAGCWCTWPYHFLRRPRRKDTYVVGAPPREHSALGEPGPVGSLEVGAQTHTLGPASRK